MRDARETIIRLDYDGKYSEVWTGRAGLAARLKRLGFKQTDEQNGGYWLKGTLKQVSFRKVASGTRKSTNPGNLEGLRKHREKVANAQ